MNAPMKIPTRGQTNCLLLNNSTPELTLGAWPLNCQTQNCVKYACGPVPAMKINRIAICTESAALCCDMQDFCSREVTVQSQSTRHRACSRFWGMSDHRTFPQKTARMRILLFLLLLTSNAPAMDRWTALAMVESGGNDRAVGRAGEISRYQIRRELWPGGNPQNSRVALAHARRIMAARVAAFEQARGRAPDDFEFYVLWNAPAQSGHPHRAVAERARRFANPVVAVDANS